MGTDAGQILLDVDLAAMQAASSEKPIVQIYLSAVQSLADNTLTALSFGSENYDSHGFHSTSVNPTRVTPSIPGIYRFVMSGYVAAAVDYTSIRVVVRKNGSSQFNPAWFWGNQVNSVQHGGQVTGMLEFNGTTDYIEMCIQQDNTANAARNAIASNPAICMLELEYVRALV